MQNFELKIDNISLAEKKLREESLGYFKINGFPNKRLEDWKFTDLNTIIKENFKELKPDNSTDIKSSFEMIKDFEHNSIFLINGNLKSHNFNYEEKKNINIKEHKDVTTEHTKSTNPMINLNNALNKGGFVLEVSKNYKFNKPLIVYNCFSDNMSNKMVNNKNLIILNDNCNLSLIEYNSDICKGNFMQNNHTNFKIGNKSSLKNYTVQSHKSNGFYYKFIKIKLSEESNYEDYIFSSGLKFNKIEEDIDINGENVNCSVQSALYLDFDSHQEVKTKLNHLKPNSKSFQKIKNVLGKNCKGVYQGKIFVKDLAQKTDAYQLSKALLLNESSEFNAKPELEIYADDVKCSHGSTSGSINEDSIYYLMTRGISRKNAIEILTKAFLFEIADKITDIKIKKFIEKNLDRQIYGN